jgi:hypothetical protein
MIGLEDVLMIVGVAEAIDVDAYVLTGAIDGTTVCGEDLAEARHRWHGLRILVTTDALFRDWRRTRAGGGRLMTDNLARVGPPPMQPCRCGRSVEVVSDLAEPWPALACDCCFASIAGTVRGNDTRLCGVCRP